ncbi:MAG TPA: histidine kinase [Solirubrobacteraceae bacterium]|nr:histidine kinase [Solirubrobacteraceae bacterium]
MAQYGGRVVSDEVRRIVPVVAVAVAVVAALVDPSTPGELLLMAIPPAALAVWALMPRAPLPVVAIAVLAPVVAVQHSGHHEPIMFAASLVGFVVACWIDSLAVAAALGLLAVAAPIVVGAIETSGNLGVGIWVVGVAFPWLIGRAIHRQMQLAAALEATRRELAEQAMLEERRRIARDVHDFVGHGLAAVMLQVTSARHVLRRDPAAAEEALRAAEDVGRRSMRELRRTVALLRSDDSDGGIAAPVPTALEIPELVAEARAGGLDVVLDVDGDLAGLEPGVGLALHRIAQEALANAARHAPRARTVLEIGVGEVEAVLVANTVGPVTPVAPSADPERRSYGVIGMRERATALGGELSAGPTVDGWRVSCRLPLRVVDAS